MRVGNWDMQDHGGTREVSADIDGFRLWFRLPKGYSTSKSGDPFLASALLPAMRQGEDIEIAPSLPVSPKLLGNVALLQEIYHTWNFEELSKVRITATTSPAEPCGTGGMSFFSGGVDSTYTFLKRLREISHVVTIHGFDFSFHRASGGTSTFSMADIKDLALLAWNLTLPSGPVAAYVASQLSENTCRALFNYRDFGLHPTTVEDSLVEDLNRVVAGPSIYDARRFAGVHLRAGTKDLLANGSLRPDLIKLNRLLLEDAFPLEIAGKYSGAYDAAIERNARFVEGFGKTLIPVATNHYSFGYRYNLSRLLTQGSALGSIALLVGMPRVYMPSSCSYGQLFPLGSHPLTDPLWTNECVNIVHDGCEAGRTDKLELICACQAALENLRVCFHNANVNCGGCAKCLRTMISLRLLNSSPGPFPPLPSNSAIRKQLVLDDYEMRFLEESLGLTDQGDGRGLRRALRACKRRSEVLRIVIAFDRELLGGFGKRAFRTFVPAKGIRRIDTTPKPRAQSHGRTTQKPLTVSRPLGVERPWPTSSS
jgi:hypothetical protein